MIFKEITDLYRFYKKQPANKRRIVFYAERESDTIYVDSLFSHLSNVYKDQFCYITSDIKDTRLRNETPFPVFYSKALLSILMMLLDAKLCIMTLPDLNVFNIKRSLVKEVHYAYFFHSMISTHMGYLENAFDHFDSILCVGPYQRQEIQKREEQKKIPKKKLIEFGYERIEKIYNQCQSNLVNRMDDALEKPTILIAPSWGDLNIFEEMGIELVEKLARFYNVVIRPHPEYIKRKPKHFKQFSSDLNKIENASLNKDVQSDNILIASDLLVTDFSGIGFEFSLGTERPVLFIDCNKKIRNLGYDHLGMTPVEVSYRESIGKVVPPNSDEILEGIKLLLDEKNLYQKKIKDFRTQHLYCFNEPQTAAFEHIKNVVEATS